MFASLRYTVIPVVCVLALAAAAIADDGPETATTAARVPSAAETPILQAGKQVLQNGGKQADWKRMIELAHALKQAVDDKLPFNPYANQLDLSGLASLPNADPGRHTLLGKVRYAASRPPGPSESYINGCAVYLDCDLVATSLSGTPRDEQGEALAYDGYIHSSVVVVNGRIRTTSYIYDSIVIARGPIEIEGYIYNSLVISLDDLLQLGDQPLLSTEAVAEAKLEPTVSVDDGYINQAVVVGAVQCEDLRKCVVLGTPVGREPYLRGAEITPAGPVARLPWEVGKQK